MVVGYVQQNHLMIQGKTQNQVPENSFIIQRESLRGPIHLIPSQRILNLQNKVTFFQGQFDPLQLENHQLKQNVVSLSRSISLNTNVLRKLLPVEYDPVKKMKLEMASFEQVTKLIDQNWKMMEGDIQRLNNGRQGLMTQISVWKEKYEQQKSHRLNEALQYQSKRLQFEENYQTHISSLGKIINKIQDDNEELKDTLEKQREKYEKAVRQYERQLSMERYQFKDKARELESCIARLKHHQEALVFEFEEGKAALKALYEKLGNEKLIEQGETYELMLKFKEEEKMRIEYIMNDMKERQEKELNEKEETVRKAKEDLQFFRQQITEIQEELYRKREDMKEMSKNIKQIESELKIVKENCIIFEANANKKQTIILKMEEQYKRAVQHYEQQIKEINETNQRINDKLSAEISYLSKQLKTQTKQLESWKQRAQVTESSWGRKIQEMKANYESTYQANFEKLISQHQAQTEDHLNLIKQLKQRIAEMHETNQSAVERLKEDHQDQIRKLQWDFKLKKEEYMKQQVIKAGKANTRNDEQFINLKLQYQIQLENQRARCSEEIKKMQKQQFQKINQQEISFLKEKRKFQKTIQTLESQKNTLNDDITKLNKRLMQSQDRMQKMKGNHIRQITKLQQKNSELVLTWQNMMENQLTQFQKVLMEREMKFGELQGSIQQEREELDRKLGLNAKEIELARKKFERDLQEYKQTAGIDQIENKFKSEIATLKAAALMKEKELNASFDIRIRHLIEGHTKDKTNIVSFYNGQLNRTESIFDQVLIEIASKLITIKMNQQELNMQNEREALSTMGRSTKIEYIHERVRSLDEAIKLKMEQSSKTSEKLAAIEQSIEEQVKNRKEEIETERVNAFQEMQAKLKQALSQLNHNLQIKQEQYSHKASQLQKERVRFVELLYQEFKLLTFTHERQYSKLMGRYNELQHHFDYRPSRPQDLAKIKQLTTLNGQLTREIELHKKRLETANQIVKYLNLQLENYKEMYDIFGPSGEIPNKTISFNFDAQKNQKYQSMLNKMRQQHSKSLAKTKHFQVNVTPFFEQRLDEGKKERKTTVDLHHEDIEIKEIKIFGNKQPQGGESVVVLQPKQEHRRTRKQSFIPAKGKNRYKTEASPFKDATPGKDTEIFQNSHTFLKLVTGNGQTKNLQVPAEFQSQSKKNMYRRRRLKRFISGVDGL